MKNYLVFILLYMAQLTFGQAELVMQHLDSAQLAYEQLQYDRIIFHAIRAEEIAAENGINDLKLLRETEYFYIKAFDGLKMGELEIPHLKKLRSVIQRSEFSFSQKMLCINTGGLASIYMHKQQPDSALKYFKEALKIAHAYEDPLYVASANNNLGIFYSMQGEVERALSYFNMALQNLVLEDDEDSSLYHSIRENIAKYYLQKGDTGQAFPLLSEGFDYLKRDKSQHKWAVETGFVILDVYLELGREAEALSLLNNIQPLIRQELGLAWWHDNNLEYTRKHIQLAKIREENPKVLALYARLDTLVEARSAFLKEEEDRINAMLGEYVIRSAVLQADKEQWQIAEARRKNQVKTILLVGTIVVAVIIMLLIILNYQRKLKIEQSEKLLHQKELRLTELEKQQLANDLANQSLDFTNLVMQLSLKEDWNEDIIRELSELTNGTDAISKESVNTVIRGLKLKSGVYKKVEVQHRGIQAAGAAFYQRLETQFPNLTKSEKELSGLIRLKLDAKEIAMIRNINPSSVRKLRHRLRKKLGISLNEDIYSFMERL